MSENYRICTKTVMDNHSDSDITFDGEGVCNYYAEFTEKLKIRVPERHIAEKQLATIVDAIKASGKGKKYDCVIGLSGGVDSSYTALLVKRLGLRPIAVHMDNGWNSELAVKNIENIVEKLNIDLYTEVLDWESFKKLQLAFLRASTPDGEIPSDHAIVTTMYSVAAKFGIKYIISGMNFRNEGMLPPSWARGYLDWKYIRSVNKLFGGVKLKNYPHLNFFKFIYMNTLKGIKNISLINYIDFKKEEAVVEIEKELGWKNYGGKHHESIYTRFYQSYILPNKFGIDKRRAHYSCLIMSSNELSREQALEKLKEPAADPKQMEIDRTYLLKKLDISSEEFELIMKSPVKCIYDYPNNHKLEILFRRLLLVLRKKGLAPN